MNLIIDQITEAMSDLTEWTELASKSDQLAHDHLREARKLLMAKYQPNSEERGR